MQRTAPIRGIALRVVEDGELGWVAARDAGLLSQGANPSPPGPSTACSRVSPCRPLCSMAPRTGALAMTTPGDTSMVNVKEVEAIMKGKGARVIR